MITVGMKGSRSKIHSKMKHIKLFEEYTGDQDLLEREPSKWPTLAAFIEGTWDGDVSFAEATGGGYTDAFTDQELNTMERTAKNYGDFYGASGAPFPEDNEEYAALIKKDKGAELIQKMLDAIG